MLHTPLFSFVLRLWNLVCAAGAHPNLNGLHFKPSKPHVVTNRLDKCSSRWHLYSAFFVVLWVFLFLYPHENGSLYPSSLKALTCLPFPWDIWRMIPVSFCLITLTIREELGVSAFSTNSLPFCVFAVTVSHIWTSSRAQLQNIWEHGSILNSSMSTSLTSVFPEFWNDTKCVL